MVEKYEINLFSHICLKMKSMNKECCIYEMLRVGLPNSHGAGEGLLPPTNLPMTWGGTEAQLPQCSSQGSPAVLPSPVHPSQCSEHTHSLEHRAHFQPGHRTSLPPQCRNSKAFLTGHCSLCCFNVINCLR